MSYICPICGYPTVCSQRSECFDGFVPVQNLRGEKKHASRPGGKFIPVQLPANKFLGTSPYIFTPQTYCKSLKPLPNNKP